MGFSESERSERSDVEGARIYTKQVVAQNTGKCVEDSYRDGSILLHLGSGRHHWDGWVNVDFDEHADITCDLKSLPFPDDHADVACSIHVIEHFYEWEAKDVLREWLRVLKPGGKLILELPSMDKVLAYLANCVVNRIPVAPFMCWFAFWGDPKYKTVEMCHKWGYTYSMLKQTLESCGFVEVKADKPRYHFPQRDMRVIAFKPQLLEKTNASQ